MEACENCDDGYVDVLYSDGYYGMGNEEAMRMAGRVVGTEPCDECNGTGEIEEAE